MPTFAKMHVYALIAFLVGIDLLSDTPVFGQPTLSQSPTPQWVASIVPNGLRPETKKISDGYYFKLLDYQLHAEQQVAYTHIIREIVNESGVQYGADISVTFSPAYQQLRFHELWIIRDGKRTNALHINKFKVVAIEQDAASFIYNGDYSAYLVLDDIRVGDQIEYSYSITGQNPVFEGRFFEDVYLQGSVPISQLHTSILVSASRALKVKTFNDAPAPTIQPMGQLLRYQWKRDMVEAMQYESYTPSWINTYQYVQLSEYADWEAVGEWAQRVNPLPAAIGGTLAAKTDELLRQSDQDPKKFANAAIRFVQDEIRYTGVEIGEYSHKAHQPDKVFSQRHGDCKDKSLLLVSMLRHAGINAQLALVSTTLIDKIKERLPSPSVFDHAIVRFEIDDKPYWADPTISHQGGDLDTRSMPIYGSALVLESPRSELTPVASNQSGSIQCEEQYILSPDEESTATLVVETIYNGHEADQLRSQLAYSSIWDTEKNYLDYYSKLYPEITSTDSLHIDDDRELNRITLLEYYRIPAFLAKNETGYHTVDLFAQMIYDRLPTVPATKTQPIAVNYPSDVAYRITIVSPYGWNMRRSNFFLDRDGYVFGTSTFAKADTLIMEYQFKYHTSAIPVSKLSEFAADVKTIADQQLSSTVTINTAAGAISRGFAWYAFLWSLVLLGLLVYLGFLAYRRPFLPKADPEMHYQYERVGGWLILPLLTFLVSPVVISISLITSGYFDAAIWNGHQGAPSNIPFKLLIAFELTGNLIIMGLSVICAIFMLKRKAMLPPLAIGFYLLNFVFVLFDFLLPQVIPGLKASPIGDVSSVIKAFVFAAVWIPYFMLSSRVRETFVNP
ncbi:DUF3857 domain-containing protein [Parapedobacter koreensis]|uniref:Transglutaminase-like superfamily protein n=1 Tax=Parapedobacter koreensis TaxID=332977 RepID=A0A1H7PYI4_9SPHI|nr:DUF3857 domain-containing protein [Parapedobacter koreensis]SEL40548.1 Transglutaminase-like superfamily protein [Parapedobacter koreensis]